jgi:hypothetical protein
VGFIPTFIPTFLRNRGFERFAAVNRIRCFAWSEAIRGSIGDQGVRPIQTLFIFDVPEEEGDLFACMLAGVLANESETVQLVYTDNTVAC